MQAAMRKTAAAAVMAAALMGQAGGPPASRVVIVPIVGPLDVTHVALMRRAARRIREVQPSLVPVEPHSAARSIASR